MINIQDIIPFMKDGWVAMDEDGCWLWFSHKPTRGKDEWLFPKYCRVQALEVLSVSFNIAPADDWTKSLIKVGGK